MHPRIGQTKRSHESAIGIADQHFRFLAADFELITVKETAIVVVEPESVSRSQWNGAIGLTQEEQIPVFDDNRFRDVAVDGMNLWDKIRVFFSNGGVDRSSECVPAFSHDSGEEINALLQILALQILGGKAARETLPPRI